jgi:hypothetical protein
MSDLKAFLSDKVIARFALAPSGQYIVRDDDLTGFFLVVGARRKTFTVQGEYWRDGKRHHKKTALGTTDELTARDARVLAKETLARIAKGEFAVEEDPAAKAAEVTLREAWERYKAVLTRKERSEATIAGYDDHVTRVLKDWLDKALRELAENPRMVADRHDRITRDSGPSAGNNAMRTLRAIYNHARRSARKLPADNPTYGVDWNVEKRRNTAMGAIDLPAWMDEAGRLRHVIRREFHLFSLLSGSRPGALKRAEVPHFSFARRILHVPRPKGGAKRAFDIPLSREMILCLVRAMRASRLLHPENAERWIFASDGEEGHLVEHKEDRSQLSKYGNDLRQTYRTLAQPAGVSEIDIHLLMNHSLPGVNPGYITRDKLLGDHLRRSQQALSTYIFKTGTALSKGADVRARAWPELPSRRIGDEILDPTPPNPLLGVPQGPVKDRPRKAAEARARAARAPMRRAS